MDDAEDLLARLAVVARRLTSPEDPGVESVLRETVSLALETVRGVQHAGIIVLGSTGAITSTALSGAVVARLDAAQAALREGPCVSALGGPDATGSSGPAVVRVVEVDDMRVEAGGTGRWPRFAPAALGDGVRSMVSLPLTADPGAGPRGSASRLPVTVLNLYAEQPHAWDGSARTLARALAAQATLALRGAERLERLQRALESRDLIGQAKGVLIERHGIGADAAFAMLVDASQDTNIKLRDVAAWLVDEAAGSGTR